MSSKDDLEARIRQVATATSGEEWFPTESLVVTVCRSGPSEAYIYIEEEHGTVGSPMTAAETRELIKALEKAVRWADERRPS